MNSNTTKTLVLAGIFAVLVGWYFGYEKKFKQSKKDTEEKAKQILSLKADEIQELEITRMKNAPEKFTADTKITPEFVTTKLKKTGDTWTLVEPVQDAADSSEVSAMVTSLTTSKNESQVEENPASLTPFGLDPAVLKIVAKKDSSDPGQTLVVGSNTPIGYSNYAKLPHSKGVYKIPRTLRTNFDKDTNAFRNKLVVSVPQSQISEFEIEGPKGKVLIKKSANDKWVVASENMPADPTEANKTSAALVELNAKSFVSDTGTDLAKFGLTKPYAQYWLQKGEEKTRTRVLIGKVGTQVYAKREDRAAIMEVDKSILEKMEKPAAQYRNLALALFNRYNVSKIKLERAGTSIELQKDNGNWKFATETTNVDTAQVDSLLTRLQDTKVMKFLPEKQKLLPIKDAVLKVSLYEKKDATEGEPVVVSFAKPVGSEVFGSRSDLMVPFSVSLTDFEKLNLNKEVFIKKEAPPTVKEGKSS